MSDLSMIQITCAFLVVMIGYVVFLLIQISAEVRKIEGCIENDENLSLDGDVWIPGDANVSSDEHTS